MHIEIERRGKSERKKLHTVESRIVKGQKKKKSLELKVKILEMD